MNAEDAARVAADPATTAEELYELAAANPEVHPLVAAHPNVYPELLQWIEEQTPTGGDTPAGNTAGPELSGWQPPTTGSHRVIRVQASPLPPRTRAKSAAVAFLTVFALSLVGFTAHAFLNFGPDYKTRGAVTVMSGDSQSEGPATVPNKAAAEKEKKKSTKPKYPAPKKAVTAKYMVDPNGNVACTVRSGVLYCSVYEEYFADSGYEGCGSWPATLRLGKSGAALACDKTPVGGWGGDANLPYGKSAKSGKFACVSYEAGMSCWNTSTGKSLVLSWRGWEGGTKGKVKEADFPW